jgi:hypothetical protein
MARNTSPTRVSRPSAGIPRTLKAAEKRGYESADVSFDDLSEEHKANFMQFAGGRSGSFCGVGPSTDPNVWLVCYKDEAGKCKWKKYPRGPAPQTHG